MFEKVLAFAGVTIVAGFGFTFALGGCSSSETPAAGPASDAGAAKDGRTSTPPPTGDDDPPEDSCGPVGDPLTIAALDAELGWKAPGPRQNACSDEDLETINSVKNATSYRDFVKGTSAACQACAVSEKDSPSWGPIVMLGSSPVGLANYGACFAAVDNPACGKAMQYFQVCLLQACAPCTAPEDTQACAQEAAQAQCEEVFLAAQSSCKDAQAEASCSSLLLGIEYLCAYRDADPDGGAPGGG